MPDTYTPQAGEFHVNTYTTNDQLTPAVTGLADGGYVIVWHSWSQDGDQLGCPHKPSMPTARPGGRNSRSY